MVTPVSGTGTTSLSNNTQIDISGISALLQEIFQKMRDTLQKQNVSQSINSFNMAKSAVEMKKDAADKTKTATIINAAISGGGGVLGAGVGQLGSHAGKQATNGWANLNKESLSYELKCTKAEKFKINTLYQGNEEKYIQHKEKKIHDSVDYIKKHDITTEAQAGKVGESRSALTHTVTPLVGAAGQLGSSFSTQAASSDQRTADFITSNQSVYDKQSDHDRNNMRMYSQKITDTTRSLTDLHGALANATNWK